MLRATMIVSLYRTNDIGVERARVPEAALKHNLHAWDEYHSGRPLSQEGSAKQEIVYGDVITLGACHAIKNDYSGVTVTEFENADRRNDPGTSTFGS